MMRAPVALLLVAVLAAGATAGQLRQSPIGADFVEIDAVVVDRKGRPMRGLQQSDFSIREDGKPVTITTFSEISGPVRDDPDSARTVVLLLDDTGVAPVGTQSIQIIARAFVSSAAAVDDVTVVRLHVEADEPFGDRIAGESRISEYRGGSYPFVSWSTTGDMLKRVADIARLVASNASRRKIIVCIGSPYVCNVREPQPSAPRSFEAAWAGALVQAAQANVSVYGLVPGGAGLRSDGLSEYTGGEVFASTYDVGPPIDRILQDAANYYLLGYWPVSAPKSLHRVEVKVATRGLRVHARRAR
jgi:VWFA-related protein